MLRILPMQKTTRALKERDVLLLLPAAHRYLDNLRLHILHHVPTHLRLLLPHIQPVHRHLLHPHLLRIINPNLRGMRTFLRVPRRQNKTWTNVALDSLPTSTRHRDSILRVDHRVLQQQIQVRFGVRWHGRQGR